jgi:tetratricopeptide (TPR) repeat protein
MIKDGERSFDDRTHVDPTGSFEFRNVAVDSYRFRVVNIQNEVIAEHWISLSPGGETITLSLPDRHGARPASGVVSAKALAVKPPKAARKEFAKAEKAAQANDFALAAQHLENAVRISPDYYQARSNLAVQYLRLRRITEAMEHLEKALEITGGDGAVLTNLAYAHLMQGRFSESAGVARRAIEFDPGRAAAHFVLASALLRSKGDRTEAIRHLQAASDEYPQARWMLACAYAEAQDIPRAAEEARRYLDAGHTENRSQAQQLLNRLQNSAR